MSYSEVIKVGVPHYNTVQYFVCCCVTANTEAILKVKNLDGGGI